MRRIKIFISLLLFNLLLRCSLEASIWAEACLVVDAANSKGAWKKGIVMDRKVLFTDKAYAVSELQIDVPAPGKYQLFAYLHHNWRESFVYIYVEAVDSNGIAHKGYHKVENIWYLRQEDIGRWFFISLMQDPYWNLPEGKLNVKFWVEGKTAAWEDTIVPMEDKVSVEHFFLIPTVSSETGTFLPGMINLESGRGDWHSHYYYPRYATNLIETNRKNSTFSYKADIPASLYYQGWLSVLTPSDNSLEIRLKNKSNQHKLNIELNGKEQWQLISLEPLYLNEGTYSIVLESLRSHKILIDYFIAIPISQENNQKNENKAFIQ